MPSTERKLGITAPCFRTLLPRAFGLSFLLSAAVAAAGVVVVVLLVFDNGNYQTVASLAGRRLR